MWFSLLIIWFAVYKASLETEKWIHNTQYGSKDFTSWKIFIWIDFWIIRATSNKTCPTRHLVTRVLYVLPQPSFNIPRPEQIANFLLKCAIQSMWLWSPQPWPLLGVTETNMSQIAWPRILTRRRNARRRSTPSTSVAMPSTKRMGIRHRSWAAPSPNYCGLRWSSELKQRRNKTRSNKTLEKPELRSRYSKHNIENSRMACRSPFAD